MATLVTGAISEIMDPFLFDLSFFNVYVKSVATASTLDILKNES